MYTHITLCAFQLLLQQSLAGVASHWQNTEFMDNYFSHTHKDYQ